MFTTDALTLTLHAVRNPEDERLARVRVDDGDVRVSIDLKEGDVRRLVLESAADGPPREIPVAEFQRMYDDTIAFWRSWLSRCTCTGRWRETLYRFRTSGRVREMVLSYVFVPPRTVMIQPGSPSLPRTDC